MTLPSSPAVFEFHEAPTQPKAERSKHVRANGALILVVDDDVDARRLYATCLESFGYRTITEVSGEDAIQKAGSIAPAAILMDASMPGIGGLEATRRIKADARTHTCPIIMMTASGGALFDEARDAGCDAYFCKPFNIFALDSVIHYLLEPKNAPSVKSSEPMLKECSCGAAFSRDEWLALPLCGRMADHRSGTTTTVELRNCRCGSTLALSLSV